MVIGIQISDLLDLEKTIATDIFTNRTYIWDVLPDITEYIRQLGQSLDPNEYDFRGEDVWISKTAKIFHCAFIRGSAIVGKNAVVGNSTELKNVILFDGVQVPHYNYVGDSILGYKAHMGAGAITSNVKSDHSLTTFRFGDELVPTGMKKFGAVIGDHTEIGCNSVLNPATIIGRNATVYPLSMVRGFVPANSIYKKQGEVVNKKV